MEVTFTNSPPRLAVQRGDVVEYNGGLYLVLTAAASSDGVHEVRVIHRGSNITIAPLSTTLAARSCHLVTALAATIQE